MIVSTFSRRSGIDWDRVRPGQILWKTDDPALNRKLKQRWKSARPEKKRFPITISVLGKVGRPLTLSCNGVTVESSVPLQAANNRPLDDAFLRKQLGRLGETSHELAGIENQLEGEVMVPVSVINELRRQLVNQLDQSAPASISSALNTPSLTDLLPNRKAPEEAQIRLSVLCRTLAQVEAALECGVPLIYCDFEDLRRYADAVALVRGYGSDSEIYLATPRIQKSKESGYFKLIEKTAPDGVLLRNLGGIAWFEENSSLPLIGDFSLNVANPLTAQLLMNRVRFQHLTVSYDLNIVQVLDLLNAAPPQWFELTLHQHIPMFHMEHCVFCTFMSSGTTYRDCGRPCDKHQVQLKDRVGQLHPLQADVGCRNTLFNGRAQTGARFYKELKNAGLSRFRLEWLTESKEESIKTIKVYQDLLSETASIEETLFQIEAAERLGVTEGTLLV